MYAVSFTHVCWRQFSCSVCCRASDAMGAVRRAMWSPASGRSPFTSEPFDSRGVGPQPHSSGIFVNRGTMVQPVSILAHRVGDAFCPGRPPFLAPFNVVRQGDGRPDVFLSDVQMQFVDTAGIRSETLRLGRPELATRFGSTTFPAFGTRTFPFSFPFGCGELPPRPAR